MPVRLIDKDTGDARYLRRIERGAAGGVAALDADGKIAAGQIPAVVPAEHGGLTGLGDDDHPQYLTAARGDDRYATPSQVAATTAAAVADHVADYHPEHIDGGVFVGATFDRSADGGGF